jgi:uncharacterized protein YndB with AHSA1/START domain
VNEYEAFWNEHLDQFEKFFAKKEERRGGSIMDQKNKRLEFRFERTISASPTEVFDAWLNPRIPGNPWNAAERFLLDPKVDGLFYWTLMGTSHYGRFIGVERPSRIQHTWVSPSTLGQESMVTLTFTNQGEATLMTLVHSDLPDCELARGHEKGWNNFLDVYYEQFGTGSRKPYQWEAAHESVKH